ncbi:hypothetical protein PHYSODRAFT_326633 [Phytophthora sojae]|uniref:pyruvate kinase n=1 Tax=Phytophthora sojae (strain P6497) TaxID=1094619 RepID=G4YX74_PHYSP|nr:hypothetical protein PHYSODRAFT_326633 [Phytophthora sojae]EGZ25642.1 hypothetical protein PHYSODRAFT_326633 [Phytophthora sojae]|eukprot:XP_009520930.1 hypothetical protein PHYSODRAFT_326633 [Phytophthora sojae]
MTEARFSGSIGVKRMRMFESKGNFNVDVRGFPDKSLKMLNDKRRHSPDKFAVAYQQLAETIKVGDTEIGIRKGVNLPDLIVELPALSEKDKRDLEWDVELDIDFIAASFICKASDVHEIRAFNFEEILEASGGIRCVEVTAQHVLAYQKMVVSRCNAVGKPANVATQMLEYTQNNLRLTRAKLVATMNMAVKEANDLLLQPTYRTKSQFDLRTSAVKTANEMHVQL